MHTYLMSKMERKGSNKSRSRVPDAAKLKGKLCSTNDKTEPGKKKHNNKSDRLAVHAPVPPPFAPTQPFAKLY